jgi:hypothetical protein
MPPKNLTGAVLQAARRAAAERFESIAKLYVPKSLESVLRYAGSF